MSLRGRSSPKQSPVSYRRLFAKGTLRGRRCAPRNDILIERLLALLDWRFGNNQRRDKIGKKADRRFLDFIRRTARISGKD